MNTYRVILALLAAGLLLRSGAAAADQVTCESSDRKQVSCEMNTHGEVRIVKQLSRAACVEGKTWGLTKHTVWVSGGCRAVFASNGPGASAAASHGNAPAGGAAAPMRVTCESTGQARKECEMDTRGEVRVARQLSRTACIEGQSWGLNKHTVWVSNGCRAEFENASRRAAPASRPAARGPTDLQIRACNAVEDRYGEVVSSTELRPGAYEIILSYADGKYACDVSASGKVDGFQKLD